jgi:hypothetical protein
MQGALELELRELRQRLMDVEQQFSGREDELHRQVASLRDKLLTAEVRCSAVVVVAWMLCATPGCLVPCDVM